MNPSRTIPSAARVCSLAMLTLWLGACATEKDLTHVVRISVPQQRLAVYDLGHEIALAADPIADQAKHAEMHGLVDRQAPSLFMPTRREGEHIGQWVA